MIVRNLNHLREELIKGVRRAANASLESLSQHVYVTVTDDYIKRIQQLHYPMRHPQTREIVESMQPKDIVHSIVKSITEVKAVVYITPKTEADKSARMQELYGGKPWQKIRVDMQNLDYVNFVLASMGMRGIKAMSR